MYPALEKLKRSSKPKTYWFYRFPIWLRTLLGVLIWPLFVPILIYPQIRARLGVKIGMLLGWVVFCIFVVGLIVLIWPGSSILNRDAIAINVFGVSENAIFQDNKVTITIKTDPTPVDELTANGEKLSFGWFRREYKFEKTLPEGQNSILIIAKKDGQRSEKKIDFKIDLTEQKNQTRQQKNESSKAQEVREARPIYQKVSDLASEVFGSSKNYRSTLSGSTARLTFRLGDRFFFNETDTLEGILSDMVKYGRGAFTIKEIDQVDIQYVNVNVDQFGAESENPSMSATISRANFTKYNFDNIKGRNFFNSVKDNITLNISEELTAKINFERINVNGY